MGLFEMFASNEITKLFKVNFAYVKLRAWNKLAAAESYMRQLENKELMSSIFSHTQGEY